MQLYTTEGGGLSSSQVKRMPPAYSWSEKARYACLCGQHYAVLRWRWIDRESEPERARRAEAGSALEGRCPSCGADARASVDCVLIDASQERVTLLLGDDRRDELLGTIRRYFEELEKRHPGGAEFLLRPDWRFVGAASERSKGAQQRPADAKREQSSAQSAGVPTALDPKPRLNRPRSQPEEDGRAYIAHLRLDDEEKVVVDAFLDAEGKRLWGAAALRGRPILLREYGYPLLGVRLVASYVGRSSSIDALLDVGEDDANRVFLALSREFRLQLSIQGDDGDAVLRRGVSAVALERNAALCLESARAALAAGEFPPGAFEDALERLEGTPKNKRLSEGSKGVVAVGAFQHLISSAEAWKALEQLDQLSEKQTLSRMLEVEGFPVGEYEELRKRVLKGALEFGLCAPRRFWRRIIASGLAESAEDYVQRLCDARRAASEGGEELSVEQRIGAWERIEELCRRRGVTPPEPLLHALDLSVRDFPPPKRGGRERAKLSGELVASPSESKAESAVNSSNAKNNPQGNSQDNEASVVDLSRVIEAVEHGSGPEAARKVVANLERYSEDQLLAMLPALAERGEALTSELSAKLWSPRPECRQVAAILLGRNPSSLGLRPLLDVLMTEEDSVWEDYARSMGAYGPRALKFLCADLREPIDASLEGRRRNDSLGRWLRLHFLMTPKGGGRVRTPWRRWQRRPRTRSLSWRSEPLLHWAK